MKKRLESKTQRLIDLVECNRVLTNAALNVAGELYKDDTQAEYEAKVRILKESNEMYELLTEMADKIKGD